MPTQQLTLFPSQPLDPSDITRRTTLSATLELFAAHLKREGKSEHTIKAFLGDMALLAEKYGGEATLGTFTTSVLNEFLHWMEAERGVPCSRKTYARRVTTLKVYFKWLHSLGALASDPARALIQRSGPAPLSDALTPRQIQDCVQTARRMRRGDEEDYRPEFIFRPLVETGIKKGETASLCLEDIDRSNPQRPVMLIRHKAHNVYKERRIEFSPELLALYDRYRLQYAPKKEVFTCTTRNLEYILTDIGTAAGIPFKLSFENLRWTMAVRDYRAGMDEEAIRDKLGLSRPSWYETSAKIRQLVEQQLREEGGL
jgi:integrase/recombinase XerD